MVVFSEGPGEGPLFPVYELKRIFESSGGAAWIEAGMKCGVVVSEIKRKQGLESGFVFREKACTPLLT